MKGFLVLILLISFAAQAAVKIECSSGDLRFVVTGQSASDLKVTLRGETVDADGILNNDEVDLVAKFKSIGEMTLFAKIGKNAPENYIFSQGQRNSVVCR